VGEHELTPEETGRLRRLWESEHRGVEPGGFWSKADVKKRPARCAYCGEDADGHWTRKPVCLDCQAEILFGVVPPPGRVTHGKAGHVPAGMSLVRRGHRPGLRDEGGRPGPRHCGGESGSWDNALGAVEDDD
jgi:hypothetical protein